MIHVSKVWLFVAAAYLLAMSRTTQAADVSTLLPFVDEQTAVVLRIEPAQLSSEFRERLGWASGFMPATVRGQLRRVLQSPNIGEAYVVASLGDLPDEIPFVVFRRPAEWKEADSMAVVDGTEFKTQTTGDAVIVALPSVIKRLRQVSSSSTRDAVRAMFAESGDGPLQLAMTLNDDQRRVIGELWQPLLDRHFPVDANVVANIKWAVVTVNDMDRLSIELNAQTTGKPIAAELWASIQQDLPEVLQLKSIKRQKAPPDRLRAKVDLSSQWVNSTLDGWISAAKLRSAKQNFSRIALAMHNYHSAYKRLPSAASKDPSGTPLLSWRVQVLAFLGPQEQKLFRRFHMDEPWDSPHNRQLIKEIPDAYRIDATAKPDGRSTIAIPVGESMVFHNDEPKFSDITDGLSNTIMAVEVPEDRAEIWTKPGGGVVIDPDDPAQAIGGHFGDEALVLWGNGAVRMLNVIKYRGTLHSMFTRNGKEGFKHPSVGDKP